MLEEHGAYWDDSEADGYWLVYKRYEPRADLVATVWFRAPVYRAAVFEKVADYQSRLPFWSERRPAALFSSESEAIASAEHLVTQTYLSVATTVDLPAEASQRDRRGVRHLDGNLGIPTCWSMVRDFVVGSLSLFIVIAVIGTFWTWVRIQGRKYTDAEITDRYIVRLYVAGAMALGISAWGTIRSLKLRRVLLKLRSEDVVAGQFGITPDDLRRIADGRRIMPQVNIKGVDYYNPADFGDLTTLLQPAPPPQSEVLLHPVHTSDSGSDDLLRPTESAPDEIAP
jgi:hypothetical protein